MPHLSPMNWILMLMTFWVTIMLVSSIYWWHQPSSWPTMSSQKLLLKPSYTWNW